MIRSFLFNDFTYCLGYDLIDSCKEVINSFMSFSDIEKFVAINNNKAFFKNSFKFLNMYFKDKALINTYVIKYVEKIIIKDYVYELKNIINNASTSYIINISNFENDLKKSFNNNSVKTIIDELNSQINIEEHTVNFANIINNLDVKIHSNNKLLKKTISSKIKTLKILNINLLLKKINNKKVYNKIFNSFRYSTYINKNTFKSKSIIDICINKIKNKLIYENKKDKNAKKVKIIIKELISELKVKLNSNENNKLNYGIQYSPENKYYNLFYNYYLLSFIKDIINNQQYSSIEKLFENYYPYIKNKSNYLLNVKDLFNFFNYFSDNIIKVYPLKKIQENNNNNNNNNNINKVFYSSVNRNDYKNIIDFNNLN